MQKAAPASRHSLFSSGANRLAFYTALRGTVAAAVPFLVLRTLGYPLEAMFATIAVLNLSIADSGGPYRQRLVVMGTMALIIPLILMAGMRSREIWWLAVGLMFVVSMVGGMARLFGPAGTSIGLLSGVVCLIGIEVPGDWKHSLICAGSYFLGASWTLLMALIVWRLRPYRRVRYEIGESFRQLAEAVSLLGVRCASPQHDCEADLAEAQVKVRAAIEQAEHTLGETLNQTATLPAFLDDLIVLARAASRISASAGSLAGALNLDDIYKYPQEARAELGSVLAEIEAGCRDIAQRLLEEPDTVDPSSAEELAQRWRRIDLTTGELPSLEEAEAFINVIRRQLETAQRVVDRLGSQGHGVRILPPLHGPSFPNFHWSTIRSNLSFNSLIFRHAIRVAVAASAGTAAFVIWNIPHGIWIPLTVLIVLQPQLGATLNRAMHRTGGTLLGAILAGVLVWLFRDSAVIDASILACFFMTLFFLRRHYWIAMIFLTPLIILLLSLLIDRPWIDIIERMATTVGGAAVALAAGYLLWPSWEYRRLPDEIADATDANARYLSAVLRAVDRGTEAGWPLAGIRAQAELATTNARASLERMLAEPVRVHDDTRRAIPLVAHLERLTRHVTRLSIYLHATAHRAVPMAALAEVFERKMRDISDAVHSGQAYRVDESVEQAYSQNRRVWQAGEESPDMDWQIVDSLVGSVVADVNSLQSVLADTRNPASSVIKTS